MMAKTAAVAQARRAIGGAAGPMAHARTVR
jgi:hypothetical protein